MFFDGLVWNAEYIPDRAEWPNEEWLFPRKHGPATAKNRLADLPSLGDPALSEGWCAQINTFTFTSSLMLFYKYRHE